MNLKYLCFISSQDLAKSLEKYGKLLAYTSNGDEIIIFYDKSCPFKSKMFAVSVTLTDNDDSYDLFEYESVLYNDIEVKEEITSVVDFLLSYKKGILTNPFVKNWIKNK